MYHCHVVANAENAVRVFSRSIERCPELPEIFHLDEWLIAENLGYEGMLHTTISTLLVMPAGQL